ncbi:MAG: YybH family protein [Candidatus Heimdallarchaeota archaeon]
MRHYNIIFICSLFIFLLIIGCDEKKEISTQADVKAIETFISRATQINNDGDFEAWADLFDEKGIFMPSNAPEITTHEGLVADCKADFDEFKYDIIITPVEINILGEWAFSRTTVTGTMTNKASGESSKIDVKEIAIYKRQTNGEWKLWRLIGNSNLP